MTPNPFGLGLGLAGNGIFLSKGIIHTEFRKEIIIIPENETMDLDIYFGVSSIILLFLFVVDILLSFSRK